jgi:hypothetical protein
VKVINTAHIDYTLHTAHFGYTHTDHNHNPYNLGFRGVGDGFGGPRGRVRGAYEDFARLDPAWGSAS